MTIYHEFKNLSVEETLAFIDLLMSLIQPRRCELMVHMPHI